MLLRVGTAVVGTRRCCLWLLSLTYQTSNLSGSLVELGCPQNNQIFFSVPTETNRNSICFGCFSVCFAKPKNIFFGLFWFFGPILKQTEFCRKNQKNLQKMFSYVFRIAFSRNQKKIFPPFVSMFRTGIETNRTYGLGN